MTLNLASVVLIAFGAWLGLMAGCIAMWLAFKANDKVNELTDETGRLGELEYRMQCMETWRRDAVESRLTR